VCWCDGRRCDAEEEGGGGGGEGVEGGGEVCRGQGGHLQQQLDDVGVAPAAAALAAA
jgi:hypothetical protein